MSEKMNVGGKLLKVKRFSESLYRADRSKNSNYINAPLKYFTLYKDEVSAYTQHGMPYIKRWKPREELVLVDILDKKTREALEELLEEPLSHLKNGKNSLSISFPIIKNRVSRVSEENAKYHDDNVVKAICSLDGIDGYYMDRLETNNGKYVFHSEVALCNTALPKIELKEKSSAQAPPSLPGYKSRRRNNNNTNNNRNNNNKNTNSTRKKTRMFSRRLFENNSNSNNSISFPRKLFNNSNN
jgi:hypothetical protein